MRNLSFIILLVLLNSGKSLGQYDFIVVGGGTAGCAVARRLAENGKFTVLVMESGGYPKPGNEIPAMAPSFVADPEVTFQYSSTPQRKAALRNDGIIAPIAGRMLGGTSSLNYMWFNRGNPRDYDNWANISKDDSWKYSNMLKYFKKIESYAGDFPSDQHGYSGPIAVTRPKYAPGLDYWLEAGRSLGYKIADSNGPQQISFAPVEFAKKSGRRASSYIGYLKPIMNQANVHVLLQTNATKLIFKEDRAIGVQFESQSEELQKLSRGILYATKEIIVSSGAYNSPLLLQRSGVGPRKLLESAGIPVIRDLPVGLNFRDHVALPIHLNIRNKSAVMNEERDLTSETLAFYNLHGDGPYSNTRGGTGQAFFASSVAVSEGENDWADIHICMAHSTEPYLSAYIATNTSGVDSENAKAEVPMSASLFLVRPKSKGSIFINPKDPFGPPILDVGYFSDPKDLDRMFDGVKEALRIFEQTAAYKRLGTRVVTFGFDECNQTKKGSDEFWKCYIKYISQAGLHPGGTCRMGSVNDPEAVVDSELRVLGIQGLRVVDASIIPVQTNANTHVAVYAVAEKASELILKEWTKL